MRKNMAKILLVSCLFFVLTPVALAANLGDRHLSEGCIGDDVAELQYRLNTMGFWSGTVDGIFGEITANAVTSYQRANGLVADSAVGPETLRSLNVNKGAYRGSYGRFSSRDIELLARLVHAEARGETYTGKVAVAATVLNRLNDPNYPSSLSEIVFQVVDGYYQYSPVLDGQINIPADNESRMAVMEALEGNDPTGGATTFFNPSKTNDQWVRSRQYVTTIGNHVFSK